MAKYNVRVEYESKPIRHIAVQCPKCESWFNGWDVKTGRQDLSDDDDIYMSTFICPLCQNQFGCCGDYLNKNSSEPDIKECDYPEIYKDVKNKKVTWE